ncbi:MAG: hypothetical protein CXZ00_12600 [Acidobacteria bacterium]|nr:MAG: hypothetical protein CXZ00_12600 [Acidobacteriota bacterium]
MVGLRPYASGDIMITHPTPVLLMGIGDRNIFTRASLSVSAPGGAGDTITGGMDIASTAITVGKAASGVIENGVIAISIMVGVMIAIVVNGMNTAAGRTGEMVVMDMVAITATVMMEIMAITADMVASKKTRWGGQAAPLLIPPVCFRVAHFWGFANQLAIPNELGQFG